MAHYKHAAIFKVFTVACLTPCMEYWHLHEVSTAFAEEDLLMKKIEQRTGYGAKRVRRSE